MTAPLLFHTGEFWVTFLMFLPLYAVLRPRKWQMVTFVILFSLYFYFRASGRFVLLLAATSLMDYSLSHLMKIGRTRWSKKLCLVLSILSSVGVLAYFKYANFFLWNWNMMVQGNFEPLEILLPAGISFYTFQSISYIVDVYHDKMEPAQNWWDYIFFLSFFPAILAGPIMRASYFLPQIQKSPEPVTMQDVYGGLWLVMTGVVKKAVFADYLANYCNLVFDSPVSYSGFENLMAVAGYTMQIYFDFSGYSDMAIGLAAIMGFKIGPNFRSPYKSRNITDFWRRWHISLSSWLRDYIYIPLGGNRHGAIRMYVANFVTMLVAGLWHGAAWRFVLWGGMHGLGLVVHKMSRGWLQGVRDTWLVRATAWAITMGYVGGLWILFRSPDYESAWMMVKRIFTSFYISSIVPMLQIRWLWITVLAIGIISQSLPQKFYLQLQNGFMSAPWVVKTAMFIVMALSVAWMGSREIVPFIYTSF